MSLVDLSLGSVGPIWKLQVVGALLVLVGGEEGEAPGGMGVQVLLLGVIMDENAGGLSES